MLLHLIVIGGGGGGVILWRLYENLSYKNDVMLLIIGFIFIFIYLMKDKI